MKKFLIIGAGAMGSAFSMPCIDNRNKVTLVGTHLEDKLINKLKIKYYHPSLKSYLSKKIELKKFDTIKSLIMKKPDYIVIAVSSKGIEWVCDQLSEFLVHDFCDSCELCEGSRRWRTCLFAIVESHVHQSQIQYERSGRVLRRI